MITRRFSGSIAVTVSWRNSTPSLGDVAVVQEHVGRRLSAEQHIQFGEPEVERVVSVDQRDVNRVPE